MSIASVFLHLPEFRGCQQQLEKSGGVPITYLSTKLIQKYTQLTQGNIKRGLMRYAENRTTERKQRYLELSDQYILGFVDGVRIHGDSKY